MTAFLLELDRPFPVTYPIRALALAVAFVLFAVPLHAQSSTPPDAPGRVDNLNAFIEDPTVFAQNQEPTHAPRTIPYPSLDSARAANVFGTELETRWSESPFFQLLNGTWAFAFYERPADVPTTYDGIDWETIRVPKSWQTAGYDQLVYQNTPLTWTGIDQATNTSPPDVPDDYNPVGVYRRTFTVSADWSDRRTFLHFEGVKQAYFVWVNGTYVGYDQGSATPAEFDVTDALNYGSENQITVQVYRFSDGEALETQDCVRFSGIHRSVYLFSKPRVHVRDLVVRTALDDTHQTGTLTVDAVLANHGNGGEHTVTGTLFDPDGEPVTTLSSSTTISGATATVTLEGEVSNPLLWSAETPHLYELGIELAPTGGASTEAMVESVGFRSYTVADGLFRVNGTPVNIRGVNRPEHDHRHGRHVPFATLLRDVELMKRNNIDAIRTAHYPNDPSVYALADEYGLYVQDEVNVETHWNVQLVNEQPVYHAQMLERFQRMMLRDRNRPSIFTWSTGNEAGFGPAHEQMAAYADSLPGDYLLYHQDNANATAPYSPIAGTRYPTVDELANLSNTTDKPVIMGEYRHAFGNGMGSFHTFWDMIQPPTPTPPNHLAPLQGGFIWDWADQTVERPGRAPFHRAGATDGIVAGDRTVYPELTAAKEGHQPLSVRAVDLAAGRVEIGNHHAFTNLSAYDVRWTLSADGQTLQAGTLDLDLPPDAWTETTVPFEQPALEPGTEYWLTVTLHLTSDRPYAPAGFTVATERLAVPFDVPSAPTVDTTDLPPLTVTQSGGTITATGENFEYTFDETQGTLASLIYNGTEVLGAGPQLNLWRAPTLNDTRNRPQGVPADTWRAAGLHALDHETQSVDVTETDGGVRVVVESVAYGAGEPRAVVTYTYVVLGSGDVLLTVDARPTDQLQSAVAWLPRMGVALDVPMAFDRVQWYGRGPGGSFPDRPGGMPVGVYEGRIADQFEPFLPPQTHGIKMDTRWATVTSEQGEVGLMAFADAPFAFSVDRFANLAEAQNIEDLRAQDAVTITLDHALTGTGTKFHPPAEHTLVRPEAVRFRIGLRPYDPDEQNPVALWKRQFALPEALDR